VSSVPISGLPAGDVHFPVGLPWATAVLAAITLGWIVLPWLVARLALSFADVELACPLEHRLARVTFVQQPSGKRIGVVRCSLLRGRRVRCGKPCIDRTSG